MKCTHPFCRLGPVFTIVIGVLLNTGGYLLIWLSATGLCTPSYWQLLLFAVVACNGQTWFETAALVTCVKNFETERYTSLWVSPFLRHRVTICVSHQLLVSPYWSVILSLWSLLPSLQRNSHWHPESDAGP